MIELFVACIGIAILIYFAILSISAISFGSGGDDYIEIGAHRFFTGVE